MHEWSLDAGDDHTDLDLIKAVNPASWMTEALLYRGTRLPELHPLGASAVPLRALDRR